MRCLSLVFGCLFLLLSLSFFLQAHEGHHTLSPFAAKSDFFTDHAKDSSHLTLWLNHLGRFHLLILHFPIALIVMTVLAECLGIWFRSPLFDHAARFMILAAALFVVPTVLLGLAYGYGQSYEGLKLNLYVWHRYFGLLTAGLAIIVAILRECYERQSISSLISYYICLFLLFISVIVD